MPSNKRPTGTVVGGPASGCPKCGGARVWRIAKGDGSAWRQYCSPCHTKKSVECRKRRIDDYNAKINLRRRTDLRFRAYDIWKGARDRARKRGLEFSLSREYVERGILAGICQATGLRFNFDLPVGKMLPLSPTVDRKDPKLGYTDANAQIVCWIYNRAKGDGSHEDVLLLVEALSYAVRIA